MITRIFLALLVWIGTATAANAATYTYVGSWSVYNDTAPTWFGSPPNGPPAYTAQEAAALLFGGVAAEYAISTLGTDPLSVNHLAWYDVIGDGGNIFAEDYSNKYLGQFYGPSSGYNCCGDQWSTINAASAFVRDNNVTNLNYAFRLSAAVPEVATWIMMILGLGFVGLVMRRRSSAGQLQALPA